MKAVLQVNMRSRLTVLYVLVLGAALVLYTGGTALFLLRQLRHQLDRYAVQDIETVEGLLYFTPDGRLALREDYHNHPESKQVLERMLEVLSPQGEILYRNGRLRGRNLGGRQWSREGVGGYSQRSLRLADGTRVFLVSRRHIIAGRPILIRLAYSEEPLRNNVEQLLWASIIALPLTLALAALAGFALARRALAPLEQMARRAENISSERLSERLPAQTNDELGHLARVFNNTLARLEQSFEQLRRFTSDASHELRTPLAAIRSVGEVGLQRDASRDELRDIVGSMLEEVNRLTRLIDSLLTISRADAGSIQFTRSTFPVMDLVAESAALFEVLVEEKRQQLLVTGDDAVLVNADRLFLRQALVNIVHNAVKYSRAGGAITVNVARAGAVHVAIEITDSGPGIASEHVARIFDRFYRVDPSRSREEGGAGLGLAIARWAVEAQGGSITVQSAANRGCTFRVQLPCATPQPIPDSPAPRHAPGPLNAPAQESFRNS